jgi:hypothetical protein
VIELAKKCTESNTPWTAIFGLGIAAVLMVMGWAAAKWYDSWTGRNN